MLKKIILFSFIFSLMPAAPPVVAAEGRLTGLHITAIYPNAPGAAEKGYEFITITNTGEETQELNNLAIGLKDKDESFALYEQRLQRGDSLTIFPSFSLPNSGGTVVIMEGDTILSEAPYPAGLTDEEAWVLQSEAWETGAPAPAETQVGPEPLTETSEGNCSTNDITITEILADPPGNDNGGGEFVELFNASTESVPLAGCKLITDKLPNGLVFEASASIGGQRYLHIPLNNGLLNSGGTVTFVSTDSEITIEYPALSAAQSWALIDNDWQVSKTPSPGAKNFITTEEQKIITPKEEEPPAAAACPEGKFRNPATNRCKSIATDDDDTPTPCKEGQERNQETNRCRNIVTGASATLTPCDPDEERNPATNRCRKIAALAPTKSAASTNTKGEPEPEAAGARNTTNIVLLSLVAALAVGYGMYEYRKEINGFFGRIKAKFTGQPPR